jgi:hypothetical protein
MLCVIWKFTLQILLRWVRNTNLASFGFWPLLLAVFKVTRCSHYLHPSPLLKRHVFLPPTTFFHWILHQNFSIIHKTYNLTWFNMFSTTVLSEEYCNEPEWHLLSKVRQESSDVATGTFNIFSLVTRTFCFGMYNMVCEIWGFHGGDYEEWFLLGWYAAWIF